MSADIDRLLVVRQWISLLEEDLLAARHLLFLEDNCPYHAVCFHAQQAAEKCVKSMLAFLSKDIPELHDLRALCQLLPPELRPPLDDTQLDRLSRLAEAGYPGLGEQLGRAQAEEACSLALVMRDWVMKEE